MSKELNILQIGLANWENHYDIPENMSWYYFYPNSSKALREIIEKEDINRFHAVLIEDGQYAKDLFSYVKYFEPYTLFYNQNLQINDREVVDFLKKRCAQAIDFLSPQQLINDLSKSLFGGGYGDKLFPPTIQVNPNFTGAISYQGLDYVSLEGEFGQDFAQLAYWAYNIMVQKTLPIELWLGYEKEGNCDFRLVIRKMWSGSVDDFFEEVIVSEKDLEQALFMDSRDGDYFLSISVEARGRGTIKLGNLHQRWSRKQFGKFVLGGNILHDSKRDEINYFFHPGDFKPPLTVYFAGYRPAEGFEGYFMMKTLGCPFILFSDLSDQELVAKTVEFRQRLSEGESLDDILVEAFAVVREADKRILGMFPYDVQVMGAIVMHYGNVAEMNTGEGKTLTATMPVYLNAFSGEGVMVVTPNEYLSKRDAEEMGQVYRFLGLTIGVPFTEDPKKEMKAEEKKLIYASDIIYTTNSNLGFDYLNDNLASNEEGKFLRPFNYVIIDEIDDILLDSAQTPLIIAGSPRVQSNYYAIIDTLVTTLVEGEDYIFKEEKEEVWLTTKGAKSAENFLGIDNLYKEEHASFARHLVYAIRAHKLFTKDKDYIIRGNEMVLVDKGTGRLMEMTKLQGGLHQAIEAKEHVKLSPETRAMASITYQSLFKMFNKISGMTGTGKVAEKEFIETYNMSVVRIPTNRPRQRIDYPDNLYITLPEKVYASLEYIKEYHAKGNPLLVFVGSVEMSQLYSSLLFREGIAHNVLNANNAAREAQIISESGQMGAVTVATSMAGRGTDIKLGKGVAELGGLIVIGTERMESQRIDLQIRGRSGRQGDPGMSKFFVSLEDDVIKKFGPSWVHKKYKDYQVQDMTQPEVLKGRKYRKLVEKAQHASDSAGRSARRQTLEYAESMNIQRDMIYKERNRLIDGSRDLEDVVVDIIERYTEEVAADHYASRELLFHFIVTNISFHVKEVPDYIDVTDKTAVRSFMKQVIDKELSEKKELLNQHDLYEQFLRLSLLKAVDDNWVEQVDYLQQLSMAIGGQSASQKNPIVEYYQEAYAGFEAMKEQIRADMVRNLLMGLVEVTPKGEIVTHFP